MAARIKLNDTVIITTGKDKGKQGKVMAVDHKKGKVMVEGANMIKKHTKANQQNPQGGIIEKEAFMHVSNVAYMHKGKPTKIGFSVETIEKNGKNVKVKKRVAKSTGETID
ncbi:MAG: 50S ribosomal protein L24 [Defluviitaleaceae bacterium]|nr:50S ribosomal protein L24 [Defluviitaleaceae bacterium]